MRDHFTNPDKRLRPRSGAMSWQRFPVQPDNFPEYYARVTPDQFPELLRAYSRLPGSAGYSLVILDYDGATAGRTNGAPPVIGISRGMLNGRSFDGVMDKIRHELGHALQRDRTGMRERPTRKPGSSGEREEEFRADELNACMNGSVQIVINELRAQMSVQMTERRRIESGTLAPPPNQRRTDHPPLLERIENLYAFDLGSCPPDVRPSRDRSRASP